MSLRAVIEKLPVEIILIILEYLDLLDLKRLAKLNNTLPRNLQYALLNIIYSNLYIIIPSFQNNNHHDIFRDSQISIESKLRLLEKSHYYRIEGDLLKQEVPNDCWKFIKTLSLGCHLDSHNKKSCCLNWKRYSEKRLFFNILNRIPQCSVKINCPYIKLNSITFSRESSYALYLSRVNNFESLNNGSLIDNVWKLQIDSVNDKLLLEFLKVQFFQSLKILKINLPSKLNIIDGEKLRSMSLVYLKVTADENITLKNFVMKNLPNLSELHVLASLVTIIGSELPELTNMTIQSEKPFDSTSAWVLSERISNLSISSPIRDIPTSFNKFRQLTELKVSPSNLLSISNINLLSGLKKLDLSKNMILKIPSNFSHLISLQDLNLSYNKIQHAENLPKSLVKLDLSCNNIRTVEYQNFSTIPHVKEVNLSQNKGLKNLKCLTSLKKLEYLNVENTSFSDNSVLEEIMVVCTYLKYLNIRNSGISRLKALGVTVDI